MKTDYSLQLFEMIATATQKRGWCYTGQENWWF